MEVSFDVQTKEAAIIYKIAKRASLLAGKHGIDYKIMDADMDLTATHVNGNPLKLSELLSADNDNFGHDVFGIRRHLNRDTGELMNCFSPRFSQ